jgi:hypothetical protein
VIEVVKINMAFHVKKLNFVWENLRKVVVMFLMGLCEKLHFVENIRKAGFNTDALVLKINSYVRETL